jgi:ribosome recycling factor
MENKREKIKKDNKEVESIRENFKKQLEEEVHRLTHEQGREVEERVGQEPIVVTPEESA